MDLAEVCKASAASSDVGDGGVQAQLYRGCRLSLAGITDALANSPSV